MNEEQLSAVVEARLESMGLVPSDELVAAIIDIAWDIASGEYDEDDDPYDSGTEAAEAAAGMGHRGWDDDEDLPFTSLIAEEG